VATVTYKHQPGIHATRGAVPLAGTSHLYTVTKLLWPEAVQAHVQGLIRGTSLHVCCGASPLGDVRLDRDAAHRPDVIASADALPFPDNSFHTLVCDPPYNGKMRFQHDLLSELSRVASERIVFQHWFIPATPQGYWKKAQEKFRLTDLYAWQGRTYFGRAQIISVFDRREGKED
jgi:hypothetical protein